MLGEPARTTQSADFSAVIKAADRVAEQADARAAALDHDGAFPAEDIAALRRQGLLAAPLPPRHGGAGLGTTPAGALPLLQVFRRIGHASLPLGRLYEGHVNAIKLIFFYGGPAQQALLAAEVLAGRLFGVWNTEGADGVTLAEAPVGGWRLDGSKIYASGAGQVQRPLITARTADGAVRMVVPELATGERADLSGWVAHGMRASATGTLDFTGLAVDAAELIGAPGDYLRQPSFSAGAWRFAAVHLGGVERLLDELRAHLARTGRAADPYQLARVGQAAMAAETAHLWLERACRLAEDPATAPDTAVAYVNLARLAVERAALEVLEHTHRSIGLACFLRTHPVERLSRDLATYLRQPAPDRALAQAAAHVLASAAPEAELWAGA
ncbi:MAG: acyl-CoA dehydrogenase family protein [Geminicoccaceae bacterium]